jgi:hypothetical protein
MAPLVLPVVGGTAIGALQKKDPLKSALYGAAGGALLAGAVGSSPKGGGAPLPKKGTLATAATATPSPAPQAVVLEAVKERERQAMKKRRGYMRTILTRGGLGAAQTQKAKVLGA